MQQTRPSFVIMTTGGVFLEDVHFDALYDTHSRMVYWTAYGMSGNHDTALDITQSVFVKALEHWEVLRALQPPQAKGWLYKTTRNLIVDRSRKHKRELICAAPPEVADTDPRTLPGASLLRQEQQRRVFEAVQALPALYREPVLLHYFAQLSQGQAAAALSIPGGTYRSRLSRGRDMLRMALCEEEAYHEPVYQG